MKILQLRAENFKRLNAVEIKPDGNAIILTGKNGAGKSSVIDAIQAALCGKKFYPAQPVKEGQEKSEITIDVDGYNIKRVIRNKEDGGISDSLTITNADGFKASSPQTLLDKIVGEIAFDPMRFINDHSPKEQRNILMQLVKLSFDDIDKQIADIKSKRSSTRAVKESYEHNLDGIAIPDGDYPDQPISAEDIYQSVQNAMAFNANLKSIETEIVGTTRLIEQWDKELARIDQQIKAMMAQAESIKKNKAAKQTEIEKLTANLESPKDIDAIKADIRRVEQVNDIVRKKALRKELTEKIINCNAEYSAMGNEVKRLEDEKSARMASVKMPIDGLTVNEDGILFGGIPLSQVNTAKQLEIAVGISMAMNPHLRVIMTNGNDLDSASLETLQKMASEQDYQVWIEKVDETGKVGIVIEDGSVVADNRPGAQAQMF